MIGIAEIAVGAFSKVLDKMFPDPSERARAAMELERMRGEGVFREMEAALSAIRAEASSSDPWTSRARPSFMYTFYAILVSLVVIAPAIGVFQPTQMAVFFTNVAAGFKAIPEELWWTFSAGYLGYTGARSYEKAKGVASQ